MPEPRLTCCRPYTPASPSGRRLRHSSYCKVNPGAVVTDLERASLRRLAPEEQAIVDRLLGQRPALTQAEAKARCLEINGPCPVHPSEPRGMCEPCDRETEAWEEARKRDTGECSVHPGEDMWTCRACIAYSEAQHDEPRPGEPHYEGSF